MVWAWGAFHTWFVVLGYLIYNWYVNLIWYDYWFSKQCPAVAYTATTTGGSATTGGLYALTSSTGSAT